jgi:hypothetical protein
MAKEITLWCIVCDEGIVWATYSSFNKALSYMGASRDRRIVKLTGQIPEPKKIKKVASYIYSYGGGDIIQSSTLDTEEHVKNLHKTINDFKLIKWPYGEIIEIEEEGTSC